MRAVMISKPGGPEVLTVTDHRVRAPQRTPFSNNQRSEQSGQVTSERLAVLGIMEDEHLLYGSDDETEI